LRGAHLTHETLFIRITTSTDPDFLARLTTYDWAGGDGCPLYRLCRHASGHGAILFGNTGSIAGRVSSVSTSEKFEYRFRPTLLDERSGNFWSVSQSSQNIGHGSAPVGIYSSRGANSQLKIKAKSFIDF
jgi:hypothetical protein